MTFKQITKKEARKRYAAHEDIVMCACHLRPDMFGLKIDAGSFERMADIDFDVMVNNFQFYNCFNWESGLRVAFYVEEP